MTVLPAETWRDIVKLHSSSKEWRALSTTSSFLYPIAQEALYESVTLRRRLDRDDANCVENVKLAQFVRAVAERPELALFIRSLTIWNYSDQSEHTRILVNHRDHPVLRNLASFTALRQLTLGRFLIDDEFCSALHSHPRLTKVTFMFCSTGEESRLMQALQALPESSITTMNITQPDGTDGAWAAIIPTGLTSLGLTFRGRVDTLMSCLSVRGGPTALTSLFVDSTPRPPPPSLLKILSSSPQLRSFSIPDRPSSPPNDFPLSSLPLDAIPLLEEFTAPIRLCATLVRGRPVHSVKLRFGNNTPVDVLTSLQLSTVSVTSIEFLGSFMDLPYLTFAPVSTVYFAWGGIIRPADASMVLSNAALSRLQNLRMVTGYVQWTIGATAQENRLERAKFVERNWLDMWMQG